MFLLSYCSGFRVYIKCLLSILKGSHQNRDLDYCQIILPSTVTPGHHVAPPLPRAPVVDGRNSKQISVVHFFVVCFHTWASLEPNVARLLVGIVLLTPQYASLVARLEFDQPEPYEVKEPVAGGGV